MKKPQVTQKTHIFNPLKAEKYYALPKEVRSQLVSDWLNGCTQNQLIQKYNVSRATVYRYIHNISQSRLRKAV